MSYSPLNGVIGPQAPWGAATADLWYDTTSHQLQMFQSTWSPISPVYNVQAWGAKGDGIADDTNAIQAALNAASTQSFGAIVWVPPTQNGYLCAGRLTCPAYVTLLGSAWSSPSPG